MNKQAGETQNKPKGFLKALMEKLDSKLKEKAEHSGSCCGPKEKGKGSDQSSCCS